MVDLDLYTKTLRSSDDSEEFKLLIEERDFNAEKSIARDAISTLEVAGYDPELEAVDITLEGVITERLDSDDYPNSSQYNDTVEGYQRELELIELKPEWNLIDDGRSTLIEEFGGKTIEWKGIVTSVNTTDIANTYITYTLEFSVYQGQFL